jgi:hypothetical protein
MVAEAFTSLRSLPNRERIGILKRIRWIESFPEMYPVVGEGRWAGIRRFFAGRQVVF